MFYFIKLLIIFLYFVAINLVTIYHCSNFDLLLEQCMHNWTDKNGNTHVSLKICPDNKICKPNKDYTMGFCIDNLKNVLPGDKCDSISQCITNLCYNGICYGYGENKYCNPKKKDCNPNLSCRKSLKDKELAYRCEVISSIDGTCEVNDHCDLYLVCAHKKNLSELNLDKITLNNIKKNVKVEEYLNLTLNKTCIERGSLENGEITNEEMACQSGELIKFEIFPWVEESVCGSKKNIIKNCDLNNKCIINVDIGILGHIQIEQECLSNVLGELVCPLNEKERAWKNYLEKYDKYLIENIKDIISDRRAFKIHIPYDKDTLKNSEISEYFWKYNDWIHNIDADECAKQYFFVNNKSNYYTIYSIIIFILIF